MIYPRLLFLLSMLGLLMARPLLAQSTYTGRVVDAFNQTPLPGATLAIMKRGTGSIADENGAFSLQAYPGDTL